MAQSTFTFTHENFKKIVLGRDAIQRTQAEKGKTVLLTVRGNGNVVDIKHKDGSFVKDEDGVILQKKIFNTTANSEVALKNPMFMKMFKEAVALSKAGDAAKAHEMFNELSNKLQVSFSVIIQPSTEKLLAELGNNSEISAKAELVKGENGELITIDPKTIKIMEPETLGAVALPSDWDLEEETTDAAPAVTAEEALASA